MTTALPEPTALAESLRLALAIPHPRPFTASVRLGPEDMSDLVPHLNNVRALHWVDRAAEAHSAAIGWSRSALLDSGLMWFVGRHELDYLAECVAGERVTLCTWVRSAARVRVWRDTLLVRENGTTALRASTLWILVNLATRRAQRIPPTMLGAFDPLEAVSVEGEGGE